MDISDDTSAKMQIPPRQTTFTYFRIRKIKNVRQKNVQPPELWTSNALEKLLLGEEPKTQEQTDIDLRLTNLPFVS